MAIRPHHVLDSVRMSHQACCNFSPQNVQNTSGIRPKIKICSDFHLGSSLIFRGPCYPHWRHEPILVAHKTLTKSSTYVKLVIKFVGTTSFISILNFREPPNNSPYQLWLSKPHKLKLWIGFAVPSNVITNLTYVEDFVKVL